MVLSHAGLLRPEDAAGRRGSSRPDAGPPVGKRDHAVRRSDPRTALLRALSESRPGRLRLGCRRGRSVARRVCLPPPGRPARGRALAVTEPVLVRACRLEQVERTPVWFMRQAGRSLPEYRDVRKRYGLFEIARQPELCAEVTLQPVRRHGVDAAVMFADIMLPVLGMGVEVELVENVGPVVAAPIRSLSDVERLVVPEPEESVPWTLESVRLVREALRPDQAVIGFAGGAFTRAGDLIGGEAAPGVKETKGRLDGAPPGLRPAVGKVAAAVRRLSA